MWIKRIFIARYGPIKDIDINPQRGFQIIYGKNEAGKTLTIDAMIKMMIGPSNRDFKDIDRVTESPEGFILVEDDSGHEIKADFNDPLLPHLFAKSLDLRNILIIRNSDLKLFDQNEYLKEVTDRLTGLDTDRIDLIVKGLADYGRLTNASSKASLSKKQAFGKVDTVRGEAYDLSKQFKDYLENAEDKGLEDLETELLRLKGSHASIKDSVDMIDRSSKYINYKKNKELIADIRSDLDVYKALKPFDDVSRDKLSGLSENIKVLEQTLRENQASLDRTRSAIKKAQENYSILDQEERELAKKKARVDEIDSRLEEMQEDRTYAKIPARTKAFLILALLSFFFSVLSFFLLPLAQLSGLQIVLPPVFFLAFVIFMFFYIISSRKDREARVEMIRVLDGLRKMGIEAGSLMEAKNSIAIFFDGYQRKVSERDIARNNLQVSRMSYEENENRQKKIKDEIEEKSLELKKHLASVSASGLEGFEENYRKRNKAYNNVISCQNALSKDSFLNIVSTDDINEIDTRLDDWEETIEVNRPKGVDGSQAEKMDFSQEKLDQKNRLLSQMEDKKAELERRLREHNERIAYFDSSFRLLKLKDFMGKEDVDIKISNLERLKEGLGVLERFISKIDEEFDIAIKAISIFEKIRSEEDTKIGELFNNLKVSHYFEKICSGKYTSVYFDPEKLSIKVIQSDGKRLDAASLSKGTMDQLYLSVRLALSNELFKEGPGFFIFDDPLLASDEDRIKNQLDIIKGFCDNGWSILYFTVKEEINRLASNYTYNKVIRI